MSLETQKKILFEQFEKTKNELIAQRKEWHVFYRTAQLEGNQEVANLARRNRELMHGRVMDFCSRVEMLKIQL
jgi:hypothetical protein